MQHRERRDGGAWVDTTQRETRLAHKKTIGMYEGLVRKLRVEHGGGLIETDSRPFDYGIPAELFMGKRKGGPRQPLRYRRFATAAEAIRFAVEELPACARWAPECRSVTNASMATTFNAFTRATISHCNGVCRSDCELTVGSL